MSEAEEVPPVPTSAVEEHPVSASVRGQLRAILETGPYTVGMATDMLSVVEASLNLLRAIKGGRSASRPAGYPIEVGINTVLGTMPLSDLFADATPRVAIRRSIGIAVYAFRNLHLGIRDRIRRLAWNSVFTREDNVATVELTKSMKDRLVCMLEKPYTIPSALMIKRFLETSIPLLRALGPAEDVRPRRKRRAYPSALDDMASSWGVLPESLEDDEELAPDPVNLNNPNGFEDSDGFVPQTSPKNETFGARMIREIMASLPLIMASQKQTPENMVMAIVSAERAGMPKLAAKLRKLMGIDSPEEQETPKFDGLIASLEKPSKLKCSSQPSDGEECPNNAVYVGVIRGVERVFCANHYKEAIHDGDLHRECLTPGCGIWPVKYGQDEDGLLRGYCGKHYDLALKEGLVNGSDNGAVYVAGECTECSRGVGLGHNPGCVMAASTS